MSCASMTARTRRLLAKRPDARGVGCRGLVQPARLEFAPLNPQVARELWLRNRLRVVVPVVDELNRHHF
jgi:hypothetical protein